MRAKLLVVLSLASFSAFADVGAGQWDMEVTTTMPGMGPTTAKQSQCITAEEAKEPGKLFGNPGGGCDFRNKRDDGSVYRFEIVCTGATPVTGSGEMRYSQDTMDGEIVLKMSGGPQPLETRSRIKAKRNGALPALIRLRSDADPPYPPGALREYAHKRYNSSSCVGV